MSARKTFVIISERVRENAIREVIAVPHDHVVTIGPPSRSLDQNAKLHAILSDLAASDVKFAGKRRSLEEWKAIMISGHAVATGSPGEVVPDTGPSPESFLDRQPDGTWQLRRLPSDRYGEEEDEGFFRRPLKSGDVIDFCWTESYGFRVLTVRSDNTWEVDAPVPAAANFFHDDEWDIHPSLEEAASSLGKGDHNLIVYCWSNSFRYRFEVDEAGAGRLVPEGSVQ